ncbi:MAG: molybdopterin adenylyltransferase [Planctomycetes bacterium]|nr:molybdopterin adenylyltransferase [Planctomycetota bacterium]
MNEKKPIFGLVSVSDRASKGEYEDRGIPALKEYLASVIEGGFETIDMVIPDDAPGIQQTLMALADEKGCSVIFTTGGTGPSKRDVTPEATRAVCEKLLPGFGELMRRVSLAKVPTAILSRQEAGIRGACFILNLPGKPKAIKECLDAVFPAIPDCVDIIGGAFIDIKKDAFAVYRPH